ncbi:HAD family hydrolase [Tsukamurella sp. PLM1]|uniref:HAD family hydrolase n=1 Tax=Tsukamurella sp. PLM1 TaxID=2929795 RepID=UPI002057D1D5|nr:HAD family hydrolase [Tsukamurella sp. PLM1]BDH59823.1 hypothetical protein MTP03_47620 [Tsukamurella sp. PLM1]
MTAFLTSDLDRTLIYSQASAGPAFATAEPVCVETYRDAPLSYMSPASHAGLASLAASGSLVPTTTRTPEQYRRVRLPGAAGDGFRSPHAPRPYAFAICSNGGEILVEDAPDPRWQEHILGLLAALPASLEQITAELERRLAPEWGPRLRLVPGLFAYVVSETRIPADAVEQWRTYCEPRGWIVSQQGRKLYTIPEPVTKSRAAREVRRRLVEAGVIEEGATWLAAGDGALDADLLGAADRAIRPRHGELEENAFTLPHLTLTTSSGIAAGTEIVDWFAAAGTPAPEADSIKELR